MIEAKEALVRIDQTLIDELRNLENPPRYFIKIFKAVFELLELPYRDWNGAMREISQPRIFERLAEHDLS